MIIIMRCPNTHTHTNTHVLICVFQHENDLKRGEKIKRKDESPFIITSELEKIGKSVLILQHVKYYMILSKPNTGLDDDDEKMKKK